MNSGKIVAGGWTGRDGTSKVLQEVLADLKSTLYIGRHKKNEQREKLSAPLSFHESIILKDSEVELLLLALKLTQLTFSVSESMFSCFVQPTNFDIPCKVKV